MPKPWLDLVTHRLLLRRLPAGGEACFASLWLGAEDRPLAFGVAEGCLCAPELPCTHMLVGLKSRYLCRPLACSTRSAWLHTESGWVVTVRGPSESRDYETCPVTGHICNCGQTVPPFDTMSRVLP